LKENKEVFASGFCLDKECWRLYEQKMQSVLHQGLSDRAKIVRVAWKNTPSEYSIENVLTGFFFFLVSLSHLTISI